MSASISPEAFTEQLRTALGDQLTMVAVFGSAAAGDTTQNDCATDLMVVCKQLGVAELDAIAGVAIRWSKAGHPPPLMFEEERLLNSSHVFPIELLDIKENHRLLHGRDVLRDLPISQENLRFQLEHELKGKLIQLREEYLLLSRDGESLLDLMLRSLSHFQNMLKAALRFYEVKVPAKKREAVALLRRHVLYDLSVFEELQGMREGKELPPFSWDQAQTLFVRYLEGIERSADLIAALRRGHR